MAGTGTIIAITLIIGTSATLTVAQTRGWGAFGEFAQADEQSSACRASLTSIGWSSGAGARSRAETKALIDWSKQASRLGSTYASWHNARARNVACEIRSGHTAKCTVQGRPCKQTAQITVDVMF